jgi:PKD repeat protein
MRCKKIVAGVVLLMGVLSVITGCLDTNSSPVAVFTRDPWSGNAPLLVSFNASDSYDSDGSIVSYEWDFKDGHFGAGETTTHAFGTAGIYSVKLTVTDNEGARNSTSHSITVTEAPQVEHRVTAGQLLDEYDANEVAAELKYKNKLIAVSGYVDSINVNTITGEPYVNLIGSPGEWTLSWVRCTFPISRLAWQH